MVCEQRGTAWAPAHRQCWLCSRHAGEDPSASLGAGVVPRRREDVGLVWGVTERPAAELSPPGRGSAPGSAGSAGLCCMHLQPAACSPLQADAHLPASPLPAPSPCVAVSHCVSALFPTALPGKASRPRRSLPSQPVTSAMRAQRGRGCAVHTAGASSGVWGGSVRRTACAVQAAWQHRLCRRHVCEGRGFALAAGNATGGRRSSPVGHSPSLPNRGSPIAEKIAAVGCWGSVGRRDGRDGVTCSRRGQGATARVSRQPALALCRAPGAWHGCFATAG